MILEEEAVSRDASDGYKAAFAENEPEFLEAVIDDRYRDNPESPSGFEFREPAEDGPAGYKNSAALGSLVLLRSVSAATPSEQYKWNVRYKLVLKANCV